MKLNPTLTAAFALLLAGGAVFASEGTPERSSVGKALTLPENSVAGQSRSLFPQGALRQTETEFPSAGPLATRQKEWKGEIRKSQSTTPEVEIYATILSDTKSSTNGLYYISSTGGDFTRVSVGAFAKNGGVYQDGYYFYSFADYYYGMEVYYSFLLDGNTPNWRQVEGGEQNNARLCATAMANNPVTNQAYGCFLTSSANTYQLGIIDIHNFTRNTICTLNQGWSAAGFTADGTLYAILYDGNLATIDLTDGTTNVIGQTGLPIADPTSGTIDYRSGIFYYATNAPGDHALYTIDLVTAQPTKLFDLPYDAQLGGMFIKYPQIEQGAPGAVTDMTVDFAGTSLTGSISFTAPSQTFDGSPLSGTLAYDISVNGNSVGSGNSQAGARTTAPLTLNAPGEYAFSVTVSNEAGASDPVKLTRWIGPDSPKAPEQVTLTLDGLDASLEWDAVTEGTHNGYLDPAAVTYTVKRYPEGIVVSEGQSGTAFSETIPDPGTVKTIYYEVKARGNELDSPGVCSNMIRIGSIVPPYSETFDNAASLNNFTIIDANNDGRTWSFNFDKVEVKFNSSLDMDDWLITAPIRLEAGYTYDLSFDARCHLATYPETIEVKLGNAPEASAMTTVLFEPTVIPQATYQRYTARVSVPQTGDYYIGFHGISPADKYYLYLDNIALSAPYAGAIPGLVTDFSVTPDYDGRTRAVISFKTPTATSEGQPLEGEMKVEVSRNDQIVHTFGSMNPGETCSFEDSAPEIGMYRYTIVASNANGAGPVFAATARVGVDMAPAPLNLRISEPSEGKVKITWDAPETDINGNPLNPSAIKYAVLDKSGQVVLAEGLNAREFSLQVLEPGSGRQTMVFYYVLSQTDAGANFEDYAYTSMVSVGTPCDYPYIESFEGGKITGVWGIRRDAGECSWGVGPASQEPVAYPQDGDGGLAAFMPTAPGDEAMLYSSKIVIPVSAKAPAISFWWFGVSGINDRLDVLVSDANTDAYETLDSFSISCEGAGWHRRTISLDAWRGHTVQIGFKGVAVTATALIVIDNIKLTDVMQSNIALGEFIVPERATAGTDAEFSARIVNYGKTDADNFLFEATVDDQAVYSQTIPSLAADSETTVRFSVPMSVFGSDRRVASARIDWASDMEASDNFRGPATIKVSVPALPTVNDLTGLPAESGVRLTWGAPSFAGEAPEALESMENAESFAVNTLEGWTFIDADGNATYGIEGVTFPHNGEPMAYIIMDSKHPGLSEFAARSGSKSLACFSNDNAAQNDDWAISPLLSGRPQTIKFSARSQTTAYGYESFEFLYSLSGTSPEDFVKAGEDTRVSAQWKEYSFDVPQGALHFAIRCVSRDCFAFLVDDILFTPAAPAEASEPLDYRIYRDRLPLGKSAGTSREYLDMESGVHTYHVTAIYPQGESAVSNEFVSDFSSVSENLASGRRVYVSGNEIMARGIEGSEVRVIDTLGATLYSTGNASDGSLGSYAPGVYLVVVDGVITKVAF